MRLFVILLRSSLRVSLALGLRLGWHCLHKELMIVVPVSTRLFRAFEYSSAVMRLLNSARSLVSPHFAQVSCECLVSFFMWFVSVLMKQGQVSVPFSHKSLLMSSNYTYVVHSSCHVFEPYTTTLFPYAITDVYGFPAT